MKCGSRRVLISLIITQDLAASSEQSLLANLQTLIKSLYLKLAHPLRAMPPFENAEWRYRHHMDSPVLTGVDQALHLEHLKLSLGYSLHYLVHILNVCYGRECTVLLDDADIPVMEAEHGCQCRPSDRLRMFHITFCKTICGCMESTHFLTSFLSAAFEESLIKLSC